jgi:5-methyltetrahydropteroyltriglutamate--homocysteine methyltransferase
MSTHIEITHTGSLPRGPELARLLAEEGAAGADRSAALHEAAKAGVRDVIARQIEVGIDIVGDGEQGRVGFTTYMPERMTGFGGRSERNPPTDLTKFPGFMEMLVRRVESTEKAGGWSAPAAVGDLHYEGEDEAAYDCDVLLDAVREAGHPEGAAFMTAPSPGILATTMRNQHYDNYEAYVRALATELAKEYRIIVEKGLVLQIDAPDLAMERGMYFQEQPLSEFLAAVELHVDALNQALDGLPRERVRLHCCWGNNDSPHVDDVPLTEILPIVSRANVSAIGIAFGNPRHQHETDVIAEHGLPGDLKLIAGVVDVTTNYVEHPEVVSRRLQAAVRAVGDRERVLASPDCGFGTFAGYQLVAPDVTWEKLRTLRAGADLAAAAL